MCNISNFSTLNKEVTGVRFCKNCKQYKRSIEFKDYKVDSCCLDCHIKAKNILPKEGIFKDTPEINILEYLEMYKNQEGKCYIYGIHQYAFSRSLVLDHNHLTNEIRALLCDGCNVALGFIKENPEVIKSMLTYIEIFNRNKD